MKTGAPQLGTFLMAPDTFDLETWLILVAGLAVSGLVFWGGRSLLRPFVQVTVGSAFAFVTRERRRWPRRRTKIAGVLMSDASVRTVPRRALLLDRSAGGLRLSVNMPIPVGTILSIRSPKSTAEGAWVRVEVVRCQHVGGGWEIGCQFPQPQPCEE